MEVIVSQKEGRVPVTVFQVKGDIAVSTYQQLEQQAQEAYDAGTRYLLLDLADVNFLSSAGIRAIHKIYELLRSDSPAESEEAVRKGIREGTYKSAQLKLLNPKRQVLETLQMAGLDMYLAIYTNQKKAIDSF